MVRSNSPIVEEYYSAGGLFSAETVVNALVLNPLPYPNPAQLVWVTQDFQGNEIIGAEGYLTWQAQSKTFDHMAAFTAGTIRL